MTPRTPPEVDWFNQSSSSPPTRLRSFLVSAALSLLFVADYGGCNWITSLRSDVGTIAFAWERQIPFVPLMITPYMSLDLFFVAAPFLCRTGRELSLLGSRLAAAIVIGGVCFLIFPLRFAFERPPAGGWTGDLFNWFRTVDAPFNQFPSLHVALCSILCVAYVRHTRGAVRVVVIAWFALIAASAVLTWQHHILDLLGGIALGSGCIGGISARRRQSNSAKSAAEAL